MDEFSVERVQLGRLQGVVNSEGRRKKISVWFHVLFTHPFTRDYTQDYLGLNFDQVRASTMYITQATKVATSSSVIALSVPYFTIVFAATFLKDIESCGRDS
jgi:hypothetical protein